MPTIHEIPERGTATISLAWDDDTTGLRIAAFFKADGSNDIYRTELVPGVAAGGAVTIPIDLAEVYDASEDPPEGASAEPLPVGTYNVEVTAGKYEDADLPFSPIEFQIKVLEYFSIDEPEP